jgi:NAD(P)-dependent dehydrogenase (short-subunit alcohol dehydrogenase family)
VSANDVLAALFDVRDKVALVTGGASGLGHAFVSILADCGAVVYIADRDAERLAKVTGELPGSGGPALDVSDGPAVEAAVDGIVGRHGRIDIAFANAGMARGTPPLVPSGSVDEFGWDDYSGLLDVNLRDLEDCAQAYPDAAWPAPGRGLNVY